MFYHVLRETPDAYGKVTRLVTAITNMLAISVMVSTADFDSASSSSSLESPAIIRLLSPVMVSGADCKSVG